MKAQLITVIPLYNGGEFLLPALESVAAQTMRPDRLIILDDGSTDNSREQADKFRGMPFEWIRNEKNLGLFGNANNALQYCTETKYFHVLHQDDVLDPKFYETMTKTLEACNGYGMAYCLDERIDEKSQRLSFSGKIDGRIFDVDKDQFLQRKAEIANQAWSATLLKSNYQKPPVSYRLDMPILGDCVFWAAWGQQCEKIVQVNLPLAKYRWHGTNATTAYAPGIEPLILDEWRTMEMNEMLRGKGWSLFRKLKLKGLLAVRSGIKAKRVRQNGNPKYSHEIVQAAKNITGGMLWMAGQVLVEMRDFYLFKIQRRTRHPKNIYG